MKGLGTTWWFEFFSLPERHEAEVVDWLQTELTRFNDAYSRFLPGSYIGRLNNGEAIIEPPDELTSLLQYGQQRYRDTDGVLNILTGHIQEAHGYDADYSFTAKEDSAPANPLTDIIITPEHIAVTKGKLDLGSYGKGWLIDHLAQQLPKRFSTDQFLINGGGDIFATHQANAPVAVALQHPTERSHTIGSVTLHHQALGSSSRFLRQWTTRNTQTQYSHLLYSDTAPAASFTIADSATTADTYATLACLTSTESFQHLCPTTTDWLLLNDTGQAKQSANFFFSAP